MTRTRTAVHARRRAATGAVLAAAVTTAVLAPVATAGAATTGDNGHRPAREAMRAQVAAGAPGITAGGVQNGRSWRAAAGTGDLRTGAPRGAADHYRVGSISKTFLATVLLQLRAEGRVDLDDTVEEWLPGVVRGHGHDGRRITVRQLLNHTSGIFNVTEDPEFRRIAFSPEFLEHRWETWTGAEQVAVAMKHEPDFAPGKGWHYSNTNYTLVGMIIEKITGTTYQEALRARIIEPLGLHGTRSPGTDPTLPAPHSRAYSQLSADPQPTGKKYDVTHFNPSLVGASGDMVSNSMDLNRFYSALLGGRLLPAEELKEMRTTVPTGGGLPSGIRYGLGIAEQRLSCGATVWGHNGGVHGSSSEAFTTADGSHSIAVNVNSDWAGDPHQVVEAEFCRD